jgi:hypothetical protein
VPATGATLPSAGATRRARRRARPAEIQRHLWGDRNYLGMDRRINFCVNQIRGALRDPAEHSQYIKTVPRHGYRFVAVVTRVAPAEHRPRVATAADDESRPQVNRTAPTLPSDAIEKGDPFSLTRFPGARRFGFAALLLFVLPVLPLGEPRADGTAASQHLQRTRLITPLQTDRAPDACSGLSFPDC